MVYNHLFFDKIILVIVWNGKRCESIPLSEEEQLEMNKMLEEFK